MAIFNEILTGRFNRGLQKIFAIKGSPPVRQLGGEILPTIETAKLIDVDHRFTEGWRSYGILGIALAGGAGNRSAVQLFNPGNSGVISVIEKITVVEIALDQPVLSTGAPGPSGLTAGVGAGSRDLRNVAISSCLLKTSVNAGVINGFQMWQGGIPANSNQADVILDANQEVPMLPGQFWTIWGNTLNQQVDVSFFWRERPIEESETT